ncbi:MAG: CRTAC1 family protein [Bradymonadia bacterium]
MRNRHLLATMTSLLATTWGAGCDDGGGSAEISDATTLSDAMARPTPDMGTAPTPDADIADMQVVSPDMQMPDAEPSGCGTAASPLPDDLIELSHDDGTPSAHIGMQDWAVNTGTAEHALGDSPLWSSIRFDIERPAEIYGFAVQWAPMADADPEMTLEAGLYPDFGYNGFDFWRWDPLWTGTRCAGEVTEGEWLTYTFDTPVQITTPGLVHVAHRREGRADPAWMFDGSTVNEDGSCGAFGDCSSGLNLPEAEPAQFYNGVSFPFQYDFMVRLYVRYTEPEATPTFVVDEAHADLPRAGHVSYGDYDLDGDDDLLLNGRLWANDGTGDLTDVTEESGLSDGPATGGVWGDYDNDGCLDLLRFAETPAAPDSLWRSNCDGTFTEVTEAAGLVDAQAYNPCGNPETNLHSPTAAAAWIDIDADGLLDLYLSNFICWDNGGTYTDEIYRNLGDGTFESITGDRGFNSSQTPSRGAAPIDVDRDGDVDLFVNNYRLVANLFYENQGDGTVEERAELLQLTGERFEGWYGHTIGAAWGDLDNDGDFDLVAANLAHPRFYDFSDKTEILLQDRFGTFADSAKPWDVTGSPSGLRYQETHSVPTLADFDSDGALDLVITAVYDGRPTDFYWGNGDGTFTLDAWRSGITTTNGWGVASGDVDGDGAPDVFAHQLFTNRLPAERRGHWLQIRVIGDDGSNFAAIGATVEVRLPDDEVRLRHVQGGTGKGGQDSMYLHVGLGDLTEASSIAVMFPGGKTVEYAGPFEADQRVWLLESGAAVEGFEVPEVLRR